MEVLYELQDESRSFTVVRRKLSGIGILFKLKTSKLMRTQITRFNLLNHALSDFLFLPAQVSSEFVSEKARFGHGYSHMLLLVLTCPCPFIMQNGVRDIPSKYQRQFHSTNAWPFSGSQKSKPDAKNPYSPRNAQYAPRMGFCSSFVSIPRSCVD